MAYESDSSSYGTWRYMFYNHSDNGFCSVLGRYRIRYQHLCCLYEQWCAIQVGAVVDACNLKTCVKWAP